MFLRIVQLYSLSFNQSTQFSERMFIRELATFIQEQSFQHKFNTKMTKIACGIKTSGICVKQNFRRCQMIDGTMKQLDFRKTMLSCKHLHFEINGDFCPARLFNLEAAFALFCFRTFFPNIFICQRFLTNREPNYSELRKQHREHFLSSAQRICFKE